MARKFSGRQLEKFESRRDVWQEALDAAREIKAGRGKRFKAEPRSAIAKTRLRAGLTQAQFAELLGVSRRTLEQWEQGRRVPTGAAMTLLRIAERYPKVLRELAA